ncbi:MAG: efflux RND transporter periplasmic adaptor subunit [Agriterribacter sp.]
MHKKALCAFLLFAFISCRKKQETIHPQYQNITQSVYASGAVKSRNQYQVFANIPGVIEELDIKEGDSVKTGQTLLIINNSTAELSRQNAVTSADYNAIVNNQDRLQELSGAAEIALQKKQNDSLLYSRQSNLWSQGIGTRTELDQRELNAKNSEQNYKSALLRYNQLKKQLDFAATQARTNLSIASAQEKDLSVRSKLNGIVFSVLKEQGEMVTAQTPIAIIGEKENLYLELQIDEYDISQVNAGQQVMITMDSYKGEVFEATISKIYPMMNERSRTFTAEAVFIKRPPKLFPNLTAEANIIITTKEKALLIPRSYLIDDEYVLLKDKTKVRVGVGVKDTRYIEIISGITAENELLNPAE